jgi:hypothetical protein
MCLRSKDIETLSLHMDGQSRPAGAGTYFDCVALLLASCLRVAPCAICAARPARQRTMKEEAA